MEAQSPRTPNPLHVLIRFWQTVSSYPERIISQYPLSYLHSKVLPLWLHCKKKKNIGYYWTLFQLMADGLLELQVFTNANASMVTGEGFYVNGVPSSCVERLFSQLCLQLRREEQLEQAQLKHFLVSFI